MSTLSMHMRNAIAVALDECRAHTDCEVRVTGGDWIHTFQEAIVVVEAADGEAWHVDVRFRTDDWVSRGGWAVETCRCVA